jgi:hypothetical protein
LPVPGILQWLLNGCLPQGEGKKGSGVRDILPQHDYPVRCRGLPQRSDRGGAFGNTPGEEADQLELLSVHAVKEAPGPDQAPECEVRL